MDVELEALSDRELGAKSDIEPDTEAGCAVALLDSNRRKGLNDGETLFSVQNGITSLTLQVANHWLSRPGFAQHPNFQVKLFFYKGIFHHSHEKECH